MFQKRKIKKHVKNVNWEYIENDNSLTEYRSSGEYQALLWLKAYSENRAACTPRELVMSVLNKINRESQDSKDNALFAMTIMAHV